MTRLTELDPYLYNTNTCIAEDLLQLGTGKIAHIVQWQDPAVVS
jgi:hypothetical protein